PKARRGYRIPLSWLQAVVSCSAWMLGIKLWISIKAEKILATEPSLQPSLGNFYLDLSQNSRNALLKQLVKVNSTQGT
ncbi:hypothetical protein ACQP3C_30660, partial [Escherichia coli]